MFITNRLLKLVKHHADIETKVKFDGRVESSPLTCDLIFNSSLE